MEQQAAVNRGVAFLLPAIIATIVYLSPLGEDLPSSVRCTRDQTGNKMCQIQNAVLTNMSIKLFINSHSIMTGLQSYEDLKNIQLSSIRNHNRFYANISTYFTKTGEDCEVLKGPILVIARFKPDNLMHVIHDDILPLFATLENICLKNFNDCTEEFTILFADENGPGPFVFLYEMFTKNIIFSREIDENCYQLEDLYLGMNLDTVWYQYGFQKPRGAVEKSYINRQTLSRFKSFVLKKLAKERENPHNQVLILNRELNRKIINPDKIVEVVKTVYKNANCKILDINLNKTVEIIEEVLGADMIIGMHGAEMILSIFSPENSKIIEIMPFGIPANISFLSTLFELNFTDFHYVQWFNKDVENTIRHPEYPVHLGGINHLSEKEKTYITGLKNIGKVFCCDDPAFLHFMYQDTIIGDEFITAIAEKPTKASEKAPLSWFLPSSVVLKCEIRGGNFVLKWNKPDNVRGVDVLYSVSVLADGVNKVFETNETELVLDGKRTLQAWVRAVCLASGHSSRDSYVVCMRP